MPDKLSTEERDQLATKISEVAASSLDVSGKAESWRQYAYHLGAAMGVLAHLAWDVLEVANGDDPDFKKRFMEGFDVGIATAKGIEVMVLDPHHEAVE